MSQPPSVIQLDQPLWDDLRHKIKVTLGMPLWVIEMCSKPYDEVKAWPTQLKSAGIAKPELTRSNKASYVAFAESTVFSGLAGKEAEKHQRKLAAIKKLPSEDYIHLSVTKSNQRFNCYFDEPTHEIAHFEVFDGQFIVYSKWKEILLAWRGILVVAAILGLITCASALTLKAMIWIYTLSFLFYILILVAFGASHIVEGALIVLFIALMSGLYDRAHFHAMQHTKEIEQQRQLEITSTNEIQRANNNR